MSLVGFNTVLTPTLLGLGVTDIILSNGVIALSTNSISLMTYTGLVSTTSVRVYTVDDTLLSDFTATIVSMESVELTLSITKVSDSSSSIVVTYSPTVLQNTDCSILLRFTTPGGEINTNITVFLVASEAQPELRLEGLIPTTSVVSIPVVLDTGGVPSGGNIKLIVEELNTILFTNPDVMLTDNHSGVIVLSTTDNKELRINGSILTNLVNIPIIRAGDGRFIQVISDSITTASSIAVIKVIPSEDVELEVHLPVSILDPYGLVIKLPTGGDANSTTLRTSNGYNLTLLITDDYLSLGGTFVPEVNPIYSDARGFDIYFGDIYPAKYAELNFSPFGLNTNNIGKSDLTFLIKKFGDRSEIEILDFKVEYSPSKECYIIRYLPEFSRVSKVILYVSYRGTILGTWYNLNGCRSSISFPPGMIYEETTNTVNVTNTTSDSITGVITTQVTTTDITSGVVSHVVDTVSGTDLLLPTITNVIQVITTAVTDISTTVTTLISQHPGVTVTPNVTVTPSTIVITGYITTIIEQVTTPDVSNIGVIDVTTTTTTIDPLVYVPNPNITITNTTVTTDLGITTTINEGVDTSGNPVVITSVLNSTTNNQYISTVVTTPTGDIISNVNIIDIITPPVIDTSIISNIQITTHTANNNTEVITGNIVEGLISTIITDITNPTGDINNVMAPLDEFNGVIPIANTGTEPVILTSVTIENNANSEFTLVNTEIISGTIINIGETIYVPYVYVPTTATYTLPIISVNTQSTIPIDSSGVFDGGIPISYRGVTYVITTSKPISDVQNKGRYFTLHGKGSVNSINAYLMIVGSDNNAAYRQDTLLSGMNEVSACTIPLLSDSLDIYIHPVTSFSGLSAYPRYRLEIAPMGVFSAWIPIKPWGVTDNVTIDSAQRVGTQGIFYFFLKTIQGVSWATGDTIFWELTTTSSFEDMAQGIYTNPVDVSDVISGFTTVHYDTCAVIISVKESCRIGSKYQICLKYTDAQGNLASLNTTLVNVVERL